VDFGALPEGPHTVSLHATDPAGNSSASSSASFTIDNTGPTVSFTATPPAGSANRTATASFSVLSAAPTLLTTPPAQSSVKLVTFTWLATLGMTYQYSYDGVTWTNTTTLASYTATLKAGTYTFRLRGVDSQGVATAVTSFTFRIT